MSKRPILIVGAGGKTGRRVDALLRTRGIATRPVSRSTAIPFDWAEPKTWARALEGTARAYVTYQPDLSVPDATESIAALCRLARSAGLESAVLLSGRGEPGSQRAEAAAQASGIAWTIVRASWFAQNFSEGHLRDGVLAGEVALPAGPVAEPFIDVDDIADVVVAALTDARGASKLYEVTGPRALTFAEAINEIARAIGRPVRYRQVSPAEFASTMRPHVPEDTIKLFVELFTTVLDGRNTPVRPGVEQALGRPARDFSDFALAAAAAGAWRTRS